jgi:spoIIIJ-associated protein
LKSKSARKEAKTVDEAVRLALVELGVSADRVRINVLEEGKNGILGFGARNAVVEVVYEETIRDRILAFITPLLDSMGISPDIEIIEGEEQVTVKMNGDNSGIAIGRRGETLDALQYLTSLVVNRQSDSYTRILMDVSDYRLKREETLVRLATRVAEKVVKTRRNITLEPMNPYERRIIHSALQGYKDIETGSIGEEPNRKVVVRSTRGGYGDGAVNAAAGTNRGGYQEGNANRQGYGGESNRGGYAEGSANRSGHADVNGNRATEANRPAFGSRGSQYGSASPQANPNSYRNRSTERIGYAGNPTASGSVIKPDEPVYKPFDIEDEIGEQP